MSDIKAFNLKKWILFNFIAWFFGVVLIMVFSTALEFFGVKQQQMAVGLGMGLGIGFMQWFLIRTSIPLSFNWVWVSSLGMTLVFVLVQELGQSEGAELLLPAVSVGAILIGYIHFAMLKQYLKKAILWLPASALGWLSALAAVKALDYTHLLSDNNLVLFFVNLGLILSGGLLLGLSTGLALKKMLKA